MVDPLLVVLCTVPDMDVGLRLANGIVGERLAACVNIVPNVRSVYVWDGNVEDASEAQLLIKTMRSRYDALAAWIAANHPYDVPEIVALEAAHVSDAYFGWAVEQTRA